MRFESHVNDLVDQNPESFDYLLDIGSISYGRFFMNDFSNAYSASLMKNTFNVQPLNHYRNDYIQG